MPIDASQAFIDESGKWHGANPAYRIEIDHGSTTYDETSRIFRTTPIDRLLEKWDSFGVALAAQVTLTAANHDQRYSPANTSSPFYPDTLIGDTVRIYLKFFKTLYGTYASPNIYASQNLYMTEPQTEEILVFTGIIKSVNQNKNAEANLIVRDAVQDLLDSRIAISKTYSGDPATVIKAIIEDAGLAVNLDEYENTKDKVILINCALDVEAGGNFLEAVQEVTAGTGLAVFTDEENKIVIYSIYPNFNDFDEFTSGEANLRTFSGDHDDRDNFNIADISGGIEESAVRNKIIFNYKDLATGEDATYTREDAASIAKYGEQAVTITTTLKLGQFSFDIWPARLLARYSVPRREYSATTSLKYTSIYRVGEYLRLTDPALAESGALFLMRKKGLDIAGNRAQIELQDITDLDGVKWGFVGSDIAEADGNRPSGFMDHLHNKGFESAVNPGVDDTPEKYTVTPPGAGTFTFARSDLQARSAMYSARLQILNASGGKAVQTINLRGLINQTTLYYYISFYYRGTVTAGSALVRVKEAGAAVRGTVTINASAADWTRVGVSFSVFTADTTPYTLEIEPGSGADDLDIYIDDIQIDDQVGTPYPYQVNWKTYCFAGKDAALANPGFDLDGNVNGVINGLDFLEGFEELHKVAS